MREILRPVGESELKELETLTARSEESLWGSVGIPVREYLGERHLLGVAENARLGFVGGDTLDGYGKYRGMLLIPFMDLYGRVTAVRFRQVGGGGPKYLQPSGTPVFPYRPWSVGDSRVAHVTEGELDCLSLVAAGFEGVVGFPGASTWRDRYKHLFDGCAEVLVWADGDDAGMGFAEKVLESVPKARLVRVPQGKDVNDLLVSRGPGFLKGLVGG